MSMLARRLVCRSLTLAAVCLLSGCSNTPTYSKEHLADSLQELFTADHLTTSVRVVDRTLAVQLDHPHVLVQANGQVGLGPAFDDALRKLIISLHRVLLSTDADISFYVLLLSDPTTPGAYVTLVRYLDDIRRANANMLDTPEFFARTILELNPMGPNHMTLEQFIPRGIRLEEFLSWQLARRLQYALSEALQRSGAEVGRCGGEFRNGEFAFTLDVAPPGQGTLDDATMDKVFETSTSVIAKVLSSYHFESFSAVRLTHPLTGRNLVLPKTRLDVFR